MNSGATLSILLLLAVVAVSSIAAQKPIVLDTNPPPMAAPRTLVKTSGSASAKYDKFKDVTYASTIPIPLKIGDSGWGSLSAGFTSKGNGVVKPDRITLHIFTAAKDRSFVDKPDAVVIVDGKKIFDGKAQITDARTNGAEVYTSFEVSIPSADFATIVKAEKFGVAVGPSAWFISKAEISKFNDLLGLF
jgi:hypothetical protein